MNLALKITFQNVLWNSHKNGGHSMNEIDFDALPEAEKFRMAFYFIHQLFSYCLSLDNPSVNDALKDADVLENPAEYLKRTRELCLKIGLNKTNRIKELTLDN